MVKAISIKCRTALAISIVFASSAICTAQVQHGTIDVVEIDGQNTPQSVDVTRIGGDGPWSIILDDGVNSCNRGDYTIDLATGADFENGTLIVCPAEGGRTEPSIAHSPYFTTFSHTRSGGGTGRYFINVHDTPTGEEANANPAFAYFPIADGWLAGSAYNANNNAPLTEFAGHPSFQLLHDTSLSATGNVLVDRTSDSGHYLLGLEGIDLRRDGILLACGAKNEDNRAAVQILNDGTGLIYCVDNASEGGGENDPAAFVFIPEGTPGVTMGRVTGSARTLFAQGDFDVSLVGDPPLPGTYRLTIAGESPDTGTLIVVPHFDADGVARDNPVYVIPEDDGWLIESRDIEPLPTGLTLQEMPASEVIFHFAFFKNDATILPGTPTQDYLTHARDIVATRFSVTEFNGGNGLGDMRADRAAGSPALDVCSDNRGDVMLSYWSARAPSFADTAIDGQDGVTLGIPIEFDRDNSATGGQSGWATFGFDNGIARTHAAGGTNAEMNVDFAVAYFPVMTGLRQGADVVAPSGQSKVEVYQDASDGVLLAVNWDNSNRIVTASPAGQYYDITVYEADTGTIATTSAEFGYVFLPYDTPNLIAGQIDAAGQILTGTTGFTAAPGTDSDGRPITEITVHGANALTDGILLVTPIDECRAMAWEPMANGAFAVTGFSPVTSNVGRAAFAFAYIPYEWPCAGCRGDINGDCLVSFDDATTLFQAIGLANATYNDGDLNVDGIVDLADVARIQHAFGNDCLAGPEPFVPPTLVAPPDGRTIPGYSTTLTVHVTEPENQPVDVTIYGRPRNMSDSFTIVALPDTQWYSQQYPQIFAAQTQWIVDNRDALNIQYVIHLGDLVQYAQIIDEWENCNAAISILDTLPDLPYGLCIGNHDQEPCCGGSPDGTQNFNTYFPVSRYEDRPWYGGHYGNDNDNHYCLFTAGGIDFIALQFQFDASPDASVLNWADSLLSQHADRRAMVFMHWLCSAGNPAVFSSQGAATYDALKHHSNLFLMHGGHIRGEGVRVDTYQGNRVVSMLADYQGRDNGGDGWLRIYQFYPSENLIVVKTYSPWLNRYENDADSRFTLDYDMSVEPTIELGRFEDVPAGSDVSVNWNGLVPGQRYDWYAVVDGPMGTVESEHWWFAVPSER